MSALKTCAVMVLAWGAMATVAHADAMSFTWDWRAWVTGTGLHEGIAPSPPSVAAAPSSPAPAAVPEPVSAPNPPAGHPDAYLNFGTSSYPEQGALTVGTALPWYDSTAVSKAFGHTPNAQEQQTFISAVVGDLQHTFTASGLTGSNAVSITTDPNAGANHTLSVASGLSYAPNPSAIGITDVGGNGFGFIDKLNYATTPDELEWAVAHNLSHELMHAFGVAVHHDQTGDFLDAATAKWSLLTDPNATLSPAAVADIVAHNVGRNSAGFPGSAGEAIDGDQEILASVPEPATIVLWGLGASALVLAQRRRTARRRAA